MKTVTAKKTDPTAELFNKWMAVPEETIAELVAFRTNNTEIIDWTEFEKEEVCWELAERGFLLN